MSGQQKNRFRLILFDMDGTLLNGKTIYYLAEHFCFYDKLEQILATQMKSYEKSIKIATFLKNCDYQEILRLFRTIPLHNHVDTLIEKCQKQDIVIAIATASYQSLADDLKERIRGSHAFGNNLVIKNNLVTGELQIHNKQLQSYNGITYSICKEYILEQLCSKLGVSLQETIAIGDGPIDSGMLEKAGLGVAFNAPKEIHRYAKLVIDDFSALFPYIE